MKLRLKRVGGWFSVFTLVLGSSASWAQPVFEDLEIGEVSKILQEFSSNFAHTTASPASTSGPFQVSFGVVGGITSSGSINSISSGTTSFDKLPYGGFYLRFAIPMGLGIEMNIVPSVGVSDLTLGNYSFAPYWTITELLKFIPLDIRGRLIVTSTSMSFNQTTSGTSISVEYNAFAFGADVTASKKLAIFEPFIGFGLNNSSAELKTVGSVNIFNFTTSDTSEESFFSPKLFMGFQLNFLLVKIGAEYMNVHGRNRYTARLSFAIPPG